MAVCVFESKLKQKFREMLERAEQQYGERDTTFTILGFEFVVNEQCIFHFYPLSSKRIIIHLPNKHINDYNQCLYMLAHETFHCLGPDENVSPATVLEEGLATNFADCYMADEVNDPNWHSDGANYRNAVTDVKELFKIDKDIIKRIRKTKKTTLFIDKTDLVKENPQLKDKDDLLNRLVSKFL